MLQSIRRSLILFGTLKFISDNQSLQLTPKTQRTQRNKLNSTSSQLIHWPLLSTLFWCLFLRHCRDNGSLANHTSRRDGCLLWSIWLQCWPHTVTVIKRTNKRRLVVNINSLNKKPFRLSGYYQPVPFDVIALVSEDRRVYMSVCVSVSWMVSDWSCGCTSWKRRRKTPCQLCELDSLRSCLVGAVRSCERT